MTEPEYKNFYATFMQKQATKNKYVMITAENMEHAREAMHEHFGDKWTTVYDEPEFLPQVDRFGLTMLCRIVATNYGHEGYTNLGFTLYEEFDFKK